MRLGIIGVAFLIALLLGGSSWLNTREETSAGTVISRNGLHWHAKLRIAIKGEAVDIPADIGLGLLHSPIHTHDDEPGLIHMEFEKKVTTGDLKLGRFFEVWGKSFTSTTLMGRENGAAGTVRMKVNGITNTEFENYQMRDGDVIELSYE